MTVIILTALSAGAVVSLAFSFRAVIVVLFGLANRPAGPDEFVCPLCSRPYHLDWRRPSGHCCDCDDEHVALLGIATARDRKLARLNPHLVEPAQPKHYVW
jgi:hypothetical protein